MTDPSQTALAYIVRITILWWYDHAMTSSTRAFCANFSGCGGLTPALCDFIAPSRRIARLRFEMSKELK